MVILKYLMYGVITLSPFAAIGSLISGFIFLGGWGWILFLWFGFTGLFSMGVLKQIDTAMAEADNPSDSGIMTIITLSLVIAFVGGVLFGLSDLPERISVFYMLFGILFVVLLFGLFGRKKKRLVKNKP